MIRPATHHDLAALIEMGHAFNQEAGYAETVPFDAESFTHTVATLAPEGLVLVADLGNGPVGMAAAQVGPSICNQGVRLAQESFWYIHPAHRAGKAVGRPLLSALECAAKIHGATFFDVVAEDGERSEALARLYRAASYNLTSRTFRKRLS